MKIFVSYSRKDGSNYANHLYSYLKDFGHDVFTDVENIQAGNVWTKIIEENIPTCDIFVIIVTPSSLMSPEVEKEVNLAKEKNKQIIPCVFKKILTIEEIGWGLNTIQGIEFIDKQELGLELYNVIRKMEILRKKPGIKKYLIKMKSNRVLPIHLKIGILKMLKSLKNSDFLKKQLKCMI